MPGNNCPGPCLTFLKTSLLLPRNFGNHVTVRPSERPHVRTHQYQCKIFQSADMATQMQLEVILAGNRIANRVL